MIGSVNQLAGGRSAGAEPSADGSTADPLLPLINLSILNTRVNSLRQLVSDSVRSAAPISDDQIRFTSSALSSSIHHLISSTSALLSSAGNLPDPDTIPAPDPNLPDPEPEPEPEVEGDVMEIDAAQLMADHVHSCEVCGKGFKRDANLRMHMRAHGSRFKTPEALARPERPAAPTRFSCPVPGCGRNRAHGRFRPLKSAACVRSHFKRSHCAKVYGCERCREKSFAVAADLRSHMRSCGGGAGERRWRCSCGTSFSRKDKLFGHVALFEGHSPAVNAEEQGEKERERLVLDGGGSGLDPEFFDGLMEEINNFGMPGF
ncbi:putative protein SENSITIVE TO PROTON RHIZOTOXICITY 1 [Iris pallida]|uniref:C2H2-type domain-containing protein n=1 Tax=Iris pallida TaxID=29817 RepID=A0AAX6FE93_IRIPA|nr:putative protein SENSITIVE TO PROTON RHIZOTOXICITY 1 [Iris pallida]